MTENTIHSEIWAEVAVVVEDSYFQMFDQGGFVWLSDFYELPKVQNVFDRSIPLLGTLEGKISFYLEGVTKKYEHL